MSTILTSSPSLRLKTLIPSCISSPNPKDKTPMNPSSTLAPSHGLHSFTPLSLKNNPITRLLSSRPDVKMTAVNSNNEPLESIMPPGCDFKHWLIVMEFPNDPIDTYLGTFATVLGSMKEAKKNMYAFSTTTYTGFQCTVSEETSRKFEGLSGFSLGSARCLY